MKKIITIIGTVIIVLAVTSLILNSMDILATTEVPGNDNPSNVTSNINQPHLLLSQSQTQKISGLSSSITVYISLVPTQEKQVFNIQIGVMFPTSVYSGCNTASNLNQICTVASKTYTAKSLQPSQVNVITMERSSAIPLITSGLTVPSSAAREYYITISSDTPFTYSYKTVARSRIGLPIALLLFVVGIIVTVTGVVLKEGSGKRTLKKRSWQEPTLGGNSNSRRSRSSRSDNSSRNETNGAAQVKVSSAVKCKKCG